MGLGALFAGVLAVMVVRTEVATARPDAVELVGAVQAAAGGRPSFQFPPESEPSGTIPHRVEARWLALNTPAAGDLGELIWTWMGQSPLRHEQAYPLGTALLLAGDAFDTRQTVAASGCASRFESAV